MPGPYDDSRGQHTGPYNPLYKLPLSIPTGGLSIPGISKVLVWRFEISGHGGAVKVTSRPQGGGAVMLEATAIPTAIYTLSWPWVYEAETLEFGERPAMHITTTTASTLTALRYEPLNFERPWKDLR